MFRRFDELELLVALRRAQGLSVELIDIAKKDHLGLSRFKVRKVGLPPLLELTLIGSRGQAHLPDLEPAEGQNL